MLRPPPGSPLFPYTTLFRSVLRGRAFGPEDRAGSTPVLIINEALASQYFGAQNPVGQRLAFTKVVTPRSEEHTSELQSRFDLVCRLLLEKKNDSEDTCSPVA